MKSNKSTIIVRKRKSQKHAHHGGSWKIAYADFMTAMMAFFLVMWMLATTTPQQRHQIAEYFQMPLKVALSNGDKASLSSSVIPGGGQDQAQQDGEVFKHMLNETDRQKNLQALKRTYENLEDLIKKDPRLSHYKSHLRLSLADDGLLIQILDTPDKPMFRVGGVMLEPYMRGILQSLAPELNKLPNHISLAGHTDSLPYAGGHGGYSNWELSADRANASRRTLVSAGLAPNKFLRVSGMADIMVLENTQPTDPANRRISILVLSQSKEKSLRHEYTSKNLSPLESEKAKIEAKLHNSFPEQATRVLQIKPEIINPGEG